MMMIWSRACWTRLFFRVVVVREREREKKAVFAPRATKTRKTTKGIIGFIIIPGKEGDLSKRSKDLSLRVQRTSHLKVVLLVRPHPPREEEEKIVVAVLRATCRSMMMTVLIKGFVSSTDDDDTRRRRKRMETQTALRRRVPPPQFSFLGFYKTLIKP